MGHGELRPENLRIRAFWYVAQANIMKEVEVNRKSTEEVRLFRPLDSRLPLRL